MRKGTVAAFLFLVIICGVGFISIPKLVLSNGTNLAPIPPCTYWMSPDIGGNSAAWSIGQTNLNGGSVTSSSAELSL